MNVNIQGAGNSMLGGGLLYGQRGLKSTQQRMERQQDRDSKIDFYEKQKENLKNVKCMDVEGIARKLDMLHTYEEEIAAAKAIYNSEQMSHIMDESRELGEKIAKEAEKMEPKTPEERMEDLVEEAMGTDESGGMMEEIMEEAAKIQEELQETVEEELTQNVEEELTAVIEEEAQAEASEELRTVGEINNQENGLQEEYVERLQEGLYKPFDIRL